MPTNMYINVFLPNCNLFMRSVLFREQRVTGTFIFILIGLTVFIAPILKVSYKVTLGNGICIRQHLHERSFICNHIIFKVAPECRRISGNTSALIGFFKGVTPSSQHLSGL